MFVYIYLGGILYLNIDENNNAAISQTLIGKLFCLNDKTIFFKIKIIKGVFNDFNYHYNNEIQK